MDDERVITVEGNLFTALGIPDAEEMETKAKLLSRLWAMVEMRGLTQRETASLLGIDQPKVSQLMNGKIRGFSVNRLMEFLNALDQDVEIIVRPKAPGQEHGRTTVRLVAEEHATYSTDG
jgi:predicted XRE-type DNA-binding protein